MVFLTVPLYPGYRIMISIFRTLVEFSLFGECAKIFSTIYENFMGTILKPFAMAYYFYVLLPYIIYVIQSGCFSQSPAFISRTAKERDKKYIVKSP